MKQAADLLGVHDDTLRRWARDGKVRHVRLPSGYRRFHREDIEALKIEMEHEVGQKD